MTDINKLKLETRRRYNELRRELGLPLLDPLPIPRRRLSPDDPRVVEIKKRMREQGVQVARFERR